MNDNKLNVLRYDDCEYHLNDDNTVNLNVWKASTNELTDVTIPNYIIHQIMDSKGAASTITSNVIQINERVFEKRNDVFSAIIPMGVEFIEKKSFSDCKNLEEVIFRNIYKDKINIAESVFENCEKLESIILPINLSKIKQNTFFGCVSLKHIIIPKNVLKVDEYAFGDCKNLASITILNPYVKIAHTAFDGCDKLINLSIDSHALNSINSMFINNKFKSIVVI